ncbi:MAG TPA: hypothetical protein PK358_10465 [Spirochaetota bacterium]|nr:hypothetical protein [Spirochaetota bacterium]HPJ35249.1 hypothetical protein [Spirochaetota bacterium]
MRNRENKSGLQIRVNPQRKKRKSTAEGLSLLVLSAMLFLYPERVFAGTKLSLVLTSNLQGRFSTEAEAQDEKDPMLLLAGSLIDEKKRNPYDLYLDLGNAFYPGPLSRYSYGSVMIDFFSYFDCAATLVSSRDVSLGLTNLEFLSGGRKTKLLSVNIIRDESPVFSPYITVTRGRKKIGFIGVTSSESLFDIAEKKVFKIYFNENLENIKNTVSELRSSGCTDIILLSGLSYRNNLELMQEIPEADLVISGGDSSGRLFSVPSSRVDLQGGRSIVSLAKNDGFYRLEIDLDDRLTVSSMVFKKSSYIKNSDRSYAGFSDRLALWKKKFTEDGKRIMAENLPAISVTDQTAADILRHRHRTEVAIIDRFSIYPHELHGTVYSSAMAKMMNNDYPVFTYRLSGSELNMVIGNSEGLVITGIREGKIQGYPIADTRKYTVCSTQSAYDRVCRILRKHIEYDNTWKTLGEEIEDDLKTDKSIASESFDYLDDRFRMLIDISLSNFYDRSDVERGDSIDTPPGKPAETYRRWGMENTVNITIYNRKHQLILTPYIYFIRQDDEYLQNLLRGTLLYTYNLNSFFKPYHKSQIDTVFVEYEGKRPVLARETAGISFFSERVNGKFGAGFEKQLKDPETPALYGIETIVDANFPLVPQLAYIFRLDSFISSVEGESAEIKARAEITNALSLNINSILGVSIKHKWFIFYSEELEESYRYSQMLLSVDLKTDFKLF